MQQVRERHRDVLSQNSDESNGTILNKYGLLYSRMQIVQLQYGGVCVLHTVCWVHQRIYLHVVMWNQTLYLLQMMIP